MTNSFDVEFNLVIEEERSDWQSSLCKLHEYALALIWRYKSCKEARLTDTAIYSVQLSRDIHNEDPSTTQDIKPQASDQGQLSKQASHADADLSETSR